jgi:hypothetical protein
MNTQQMARRCPTATPAGTAELQGYRLLFRGSRESAVATVEPYTGGRVPVLLWELTPADEYYLDRYEGYPYFYRKESVPLTLGGKAVTAMLYVMNAEGGRYPLGQPHPRYYAGYPIALYPLLPCNMSVERDRDTKKIVYTYHGDEGAVKLDRRHVLHVPGLGFDGLVGYSPIALVKAIKGYSHDKPGQKEGTTP